MATDTCALHDRPHVGLMQRSVELGLPMKKRQASFVSGWFGSFSVFTDFLEAFAKGGLNEPTLGGTMKARLLIAVAALMSLLLSTIPTPAAQQFYDKTDVERSNSATLGGVNQCVVVQPLGNNGFSFQSLGTWVGTLQVLAEGDGLTTNGQPLPFNPTATATPTATLTATANGYFYGALPPANQVEVCMTAYTSGSATVTLRTGSLAALAAGGSGGGGGTVNQGTGGASAWLVSQGTTPWTVNTPPPALQPNYPGASATPTPFPAATTGPPCIDVNANLCVTINAVRSPVPTFVTNATSPAPWATASPGVAAAASAPVVNAQLECATPGGNNPSVAPGNKIAVQCTNTGQLVTNAAGGAISPSTTMYCTGTAGSHNLACTNNAGTTVCVNNVGQDSCTVTGTTSYIGMMNNSGTAESLTFGCFNTTNTTPATSAPQTMLDINLLGITQKVSPNFGNPITAANITCQLVAGSGSINGGGISVTYH